MAANDEESNLLPQTNLTTEVSSTYLPGYHSEDGILCSSDFSNDLWSECYSDCPDHDHERTFVVESRSDLDVQSVGNSKHDHGHTLAD